METNVPGAELIVGYIPENVVFFVAELVMEIRVADSPVNVLHRNLLLVKAGSAEAAYERAGHFGKDGETDFENPEGKRVSIRFRGISKLDVVYDDLEDGAEISYEEARDVSDEQIREMIPQKEKLEAFTPPGVGMKRPPDYRSRDVLEMLGNPPRKDGRE